MTVLVNEGEIIRSIYFIKKGCLRLCLNNRGNDLTYQLILDNPEIPKRIPQHYIADKE